MDWLLLSSSSVRHLPLLLLHSLLALYLWRGAGKALPTRLLAGWFTSLAVVGFSQVAWSSVYNREWSYFFCWLLAPIAVMVGIVPMLQFAYRTPRLIFRREAQVVLILSSLAALVISAGLIIGTLTLPNLRPSYSATSFLWGADYLPIYSQFEQMFVAGYLWTFIVLVRQAGHLSGYQGWRVPLALFRPAGQESRATRNFALLFIGVVVGVIINRVEGDYPFLPLGSYAAWALVVTLAIAVVYVNNSPEPSSFRIKLIGISLVTILMLMGLINMTLLGQAEQAYDAQHRAELAHVQTLLATGQRTRWPADIVYIAERPPTGGRYITDYTPVYQRDPGFDVALLAAQNRDQLIRPVEDLAGSLQQADAGLSAEQARARATEQIAARPVPEATRLFHGIYDVPPNHYFYYNIAAGGRLYEVGYSYPAYRQDLHDLSLPLVVLLLAATGGILLLFPLLFQGSLIAPLYALRDGVTRVNAGDLNVSLPVRVEDEIGFLTRSFNGMVASLRADKEELQAKNDALSRLDRLKDEFLANTSHELRTPLNGIIGLAESLRDGAAGPVTPAQDHNLAMIVSSGRRLGSLVNDILDFSRLRQGEILLQNRPISLYALADVVVTLARPLIGNKPVELINAIPPGLPAALADENRVQQILLNLVGNGIKFTPQGRVEVSAHVEEDHLTVTVADTGIGIAADKLDRIFESFEQADGSIAREYGGSGLGLAVTRQLVNLHHGTIRVESTPGQGSRFTFTLPLAEEPAESADVSLPTMMNTIERLRDMEPLSAPPAPVAAAAEDDDMFTILAVDDEPINLQVLVNQLSLQRYRVVQAHDGREALAAIDGGLRPDLVLLDVMMPHMSGYEVSQRLRERFPAHEMPVVMLTAKNTVSDLVAGFESGANDYLTKPFSKNELLARISTHLRLAKINSAYGRFVPHEFLELLGQESIVDVKLGEGVQMEMTILFSDIRQFTSLSEGMTPEENFAFINAYLSKVSPVIREHGGFIDKYIGDALMALFAQSADDALRAAVTMRGVVGNYNVARAAAGRPEIGIGIGLHTGTLMLGTVGEEARMEGTVISDAVNTAARLEALTRFYGATLLISDETCHRLKDLAAFRMRRLGRVVVKGRQGIVTIYEVFDGDRPDLATHKDRTRPQFEAALADYAAGDFAAAHAAFTALLVAHPGDEVARWYTERTAAFLRDGAPADWTGIEMLGEK